MRALLAHGFIDEETDTLGEAASAFFIEQLQNGVQEFRIALVGHFGFELDVFRDTPTGNQLGPPSTSFSRTEPPLPIRGSAARGSLRLNPDGQRRLEGRQFAERLLHPLHLASDEHPRP